MNNIVIVEFQGCIDGKNHFIVKELCLIHGIFKEIFLFKPPFARDILNKKVLKSMRYCENNIHGLRWEDGVTPYERLNGILRDRCTGKTVLTKGLEKQKFLESVTGQLVFNIDVILLKPFKELPFPIMEPCFYHQKNFACAKANALKIHEWLLNVEFLFR